MQIPHSPDPFLTVLTTAGVQVNNGPAGAALVNGTTYYVPVGIDAAHFIEAMVQWDSAIVITSVEVETTNNPGAALNSTVLGEWVKRNTAGAFGQLDATAGATALTLAVVGGTAGGATWTLRNGALKTRLKVVVGGTGGRAIFTGNGKA